jgi:hypothetical protein
MENQPKRKFHLWIMRLTCHRRSGAFSQKLLRLGYNFRRARIAVEEQRIFRGFLGSDLNWISWNLIIPTLGTHWRETQVFWFNH